MKVHISLNVSDLHKSADFYSRMFGQEPMKFFPSKAEADSAAGTDSPTTNGVAKTGYAKFDIADPPLNLALNETGKRAGGSLSHLGLQVETSEKVHEYKKRWEEAGLTTADEMDVTCCYSKQDKTWVRDPDGNEWEAFVVLENVESMNEAEAACCDGDFVGIGEKKVTEEAGSTTTAGCC
ncbi:MAG: glyoxalase/bleomycin resistance/dioxygenase family protein [Pyrinomonadaceae bacterium]|nr:glyoxalase/bleomycin resistance/dioxygenase family protein [Pyrinomonadaceae bacterium]